MRVRFPLIGLGALALLVLAILLLRGGAPGDDMTEAAPPARTAEADGKPQATPTASYPSRSQTDRTSHASTAESDAAASPWQGRIHGRVTDENGLPIGEAVILVAMGGDAITDIKTTVQTDFDGHYEILNPHLFSNHPLACRARLTFTARNRASQVREVVLSVDVPDVQVNMRLSEMGVGMSGQVIWEDTEEPAAQAELIFTRWTDKTNILLGRTETDSQGVFAIDGLPTGNTYIAVAPQEFEHQLSGGAHTLPVDGDVTIELRRPNGVIRGQVVSAISRQSVPDVEIWLGDAIIGIDGWTTRTDDEGHFEFTNIPRKEWDLTSPDVEIGSRRVVLYDDEEVDVLLFAAEATDLAGLVIGVRGEGERIADFSFEFEIAPGRIATSDWAGRFRLEDVPIAWEHGGEGGELGRTFTQIRVHTEGWAPQHTPIAIEQGRTESIRIDFVQGDPLTVTALNTEGEPIAGAVMGYGIQAVDDGGDWDLPRTDENGHATINRVQQHPNANFALGTHPGWPLILSEPVEQGQAEIIAHAVPMRDIRVRAMHSDKPVEGVDVAMELDLQRETEVGWPLYLWVLLPRGSTAEDGWLDLWRVPWCGVHITGELTDPGDENHYLMLGSLQLSPEAEGNEFILEMQAAEDMLVSGRCIDLSGQPVPGVEFYTFDMMYNTQGPVDPLAVSDAEGSFDITLQSEGIENGGFIVSSEFHTVTLRSHLELMQIRDSVDERIENLEVVMGPKIIVTGGVRLPGGQPAIDSRVFVHTPWFDRRAYGGGDYPIPSETANWIGIRIPDTHGVVYSEPVFAPVDDDGAFRELLGPLPPEMQMVTPVPLMAMAIDFERELIATEFAEVQTDGGEIRFPTMSLEPWHTLTIRMRDPQGNPIEGQVTWEDSTLGTNVNSAWWANADSDGIATLYPLPPGTWRIQSLAHRIQPRWFDITVPQLTTYEITLDP